MLERWWARPLAVAGALVAGGEMLMWYRLGAWPPHDAAAYWLAGRHLLEGQPVYAAETSFLAFLYAPPLAVLSVPFSILPLELASLVVLVAEIGALRFIAGSWTSAGLLAWLPFIPRELVTGNVNLVLAALVLLALRRVDGSGYGIALAALAKLSPAGLLVIAARRQWQQAAIGGAVLVAITLPWLHLWPEWVAMLARSQATQAAESVLPLLPRLAVAAPLLLVRRPWAVAAAVGIGVPTFHFHSAVLLLPALRLLVDQIPARVRRSPIGGHGSPEARES